MPALITDANLQQRLIRQRQADGSDRHDEVWDGVYVMSPMANNEHQLLVSELTTILNVVIGWQRLGRVFAGVNVSDRGDDWHRNYRCPDIAVFLNETDAQDRGEFWLGGPDLAIEIVSPGDKTREKLPFYSKVNTRELWILDRDPWALEIYRPDGGQLQLVATSTTASDQWLASDVVPLRVRLTGRANRVAIEVQHLRSEQSWIITSAED